jgi:hypothetical protein
MKSGCELDGADMIESAGWEGVRKQSISRVCLRDTGPQITLPKGLPNPNGHQPVQSGHIEAKMQPPTQALVPGFASVTRAWVGGWP